VTRRRRIPYSSAELRFVKARASMKRSDLHAAFVRRFDREDVTLDHLKSLCTRNGWATRERWRSNEEALLRELYPDTPTKDIAAQLSRSLSTVYQQAQKLGLEKSEAYLASPAACRLRRGDNVGAPYRFKKGQAPANKGLRRPGWAPGRMKETQFKRGERQGVAVKLYKPIGSERLSKEGYLERKVHDGLPLQSRWRAVHRIRWEEVNGPVPKGMVLKCIGEKRNTDPSNWVAIPRAMLPMLTGVNGRDFDNAPAELKSSILAIAKLQHAANQADGLTAVERMIKRRREREQAAKPSTARRRRARAERVA
jgi:hypothetical protein